MYYFALILVLSLSILYIFFVHWPRCLKEYFDDYPELSKRFDFTGPSGSVKRLRIIHKVFNSNSIIKVKVAILLHSGYHFIGTIPVMNGSAVLDLTLPFETTTVLFAREDNRVFCGGVDILHNSPVDEVDFVLRPFWWLKFLPKESLSPTNN